MQSSWTPPAPADLKAGPVYPMHPVYNVPMVSEETLNRYIHPLQAVGVVGADPNLPPDSQSGVGTTIYRVSPESGLQDFVTGDGFRHRFDVEVVYPSATNRTWGGRDALEIHPEVRSFAIDRLVEDLSAAGIATDGMEISAFRMHGGTPNTPWFMDELMLKAEDGRELIVSLNVAMRDPKCAVETISEFLATPRGVPSIPS